AVSALALLGACASTPALPEITPLEMASHGLTPETAQTLADRGHYPQAIAGFRAALKTDPEDNASRYGLAEVLRKTGKADLAKAEYVTLAEKPEWKARALEGLGRLAIAAGDRDEAFEAFNGAVAIDAKAWSSWLG